jgi:5-formyltetrahydrofolate cyclo-ligase
MAQEPATPPTPPRTAPAASAPWPEIAAWRKAERERLIAARLGIPADERARMAKNVARRLDVIIGPIGGRLVSLYWPFRGEPDLRPWMADVAARGGRTALPLVVEKARPLEFRAWQAGDPLEKGVWNIPVPAQGGPVLPDIVIAPLVGFDGGNFRLGYGGGFFDRTIAAMPRMPLVIGVGYAMQRIETICPQPHDIPMDAIVAVD